MPADRAGAGGRARSVLRSQATASAGSPTGAACAPRRRRPPSSSGRCRWRGWRRCARCRRSPPACCSTAGSMRWTCCYPPWGRAAAAVLKAIIVLAAVTLGADLRRARPALAAVAPGVACRSRRRAASAVLLCAITAVYAIDGALTEISRVFFVPLAVSVVQSFAASTGFAALLIGLLLTPFTPQAAVVRRQPMLPAGCGDGRSPSRAMRRAGSRLPLWLIALSILAAAAARLRGAGALHRPAAGADRHRRRRRVPAAISPSAPITREPQQRRLSGRRDAREPASASTRRAATSWRA